EAVGSATAPLGLVEGPVGKLNELVGVRAVVRTEADADAGADVDLEAVGENERRPELIDYGCGDGSGILGSGKVVEQQDEFVAPHAHQGVGAADALGDPPRREAEQLVARRVAPAVVDVLEAVEIEEQNGAALVAALGARNRFLQMRLQNKAVGQAGQRVVASEML